ncbi:MAG: DUF998 domain-containing protein [Actinomycetales bacterium]|nr:DUF998 domain-containing protein [Actinomycetales bacterium]
MSSTPSSAPAGTPGIPTDPTQPPAEVPLPPVPWWGVLSAVGGPVVLAAGYLYAASLTPGYQHVRQSLSDLGAHSADTRWLMAAALGLLGVSYIVTAIGLRPADTAGRWLLGAAGVGMISIALIPNNVVGKFTLRHTLGSILTFGLLAMWTAASGHLGPRVPWPLRRRVGVVIAVVALVLIELTLWGLILSSDNNGVREVLLYAVTALWPLVVVLWTKVRGPGWAIPPVRRVSPARGREPAR